MTGYRLKRIQFGLATGGALLLAACASDAVLFPSFTKGPAANDSAGVSVARMTSGIAVTAANLNKCVERIPVRDINNRAVGAQAEAAVDVTPTFQKQSDDLMLVSYVSFATNRPGRATRQIDCVFESADKAVMMPFLMKNFGSGPSEKQIPNPSENLDMSVGGWSCYWFESVGKYYCYGGGGYGSNEMECSRPYQLRAPAMRTGGAPVLGIPARIAEFGVYVCENGCEFVLEDTFTYRVWGEGCDDVPPGPPSGPGQEWEEPGLECSSPVVHGSDIDCEVDKSDQGRNYDWEFTSDSLSSPITKANGGDGWSGPGVISGKVKVRYKWGNDRTGSRTKSITVNRRSGTGWNWDAGSLNALPQGDTSLDNCFSLPETAYGLTAPTSCATKTLHTIYRLWQDRVDLLTHGNGWLLDSVPDGPNKGVHYVKSVSLIINMRWMINPRYRSNSATMFTIDSSSNPLWNACGFTSPQTLNMASIHTTWCVADPGAYYAYKLDQVILPHEAEHGRLILEAANDPSGINNPYRRFESWVRQSHSSLNVALQTEVHPMSLQIINYSKVIDGVGCAPGTGSVLSNPVQFWFHQAGASPAWATCTSRFVLHR